MRILRALFRRPEALRPNETAEQITERTARQFGQIAVWRAAVSRLGLQ